MHRHIILFLVTLAASVCSLRADTVPGPPPRQRVLFLENVYVNQANLSEGVIRNLASLLTIIKTDTMHSDTFPVRLSDYHQVWDMRFNQEIAREDSCASTLTGRQQEQLRRFLADSGSVFLMGDNSGFPGRNRNLIAFINSVIASGPFAASGVYTLNGSGCCAELDAAAALRAENFQFDFNDLTEAQTALWTEFPGGVRLSQTGSGIPVLKTSSPPDTAWEGNRIDELAAVGIAFSHAQLKAPYSSGKLFVFFDWQALAVEDRGNPALLRTFVANAYDFLTIITMPKASLSAVPGDTTYHRASLTVTLRTDPGNTIYYTTDPGVNPSDSTNPAVRRISGGSGIVTISGTVTLKAFATGSGYLPATGEWHYVQQLPRATLEALPGDTSFHAATLDVTLRTNSGNTIYYTTDPGVNPSDSTNPAVRRISGGSGIVTISGTVTLRAHATGPDFLPCDSSWHYTRLIPRLVRIELTPDTATIRAGEHLSLTTRVIDDTGGVRTDFNALITWSLSPAATRSTLNATTGGTNVFNAVDAWIDYTVSVRLDDDSSPGSVLRDTARITVRPGTEFRVVIEADTNIERNRARQLDTVYIAADARSAAVCAVVRDSLDNYCRFAVNAWWRSFDSSVAAVTAVHRNELGVINRVGSGAVRVSAGETAPALTPDTVLVRVETGTITALRLINSTSGAVVGSITMKTGQTVPLQLQGRFSFEPDVWVVVSGTWTLDPNTLSLETALPDSPSSSWQVRPLSAGTTSLKVFSDTQDITVPVKVKPVITILNTAVCDNPFTPGVSRIPAAHLRSGDPATGTRIEVRFSNDIVDNLGNAFMSGSLTILDAAGNLIIDRIALRADGRTLYTVWNGTNRSGMQVSAGTYLAKITIEDHIDRRTIRLKTLVGVTTAAAAAGK